MYQAVFPWLKPNQFEIHIPGTYDDPTWSIPKQNLVRYVRLHEEILRFPQVSISTTYRDVDIVSTYENDDTQSTLDALSHKLLNFFIKRDAHVVFHGPDTCSDKRPWSRYEHFHITWTSTIRPGNDTIWLAIRALYKSIAINQFIPDSQVTKYPGSWANYLSQEPRMTWRTSTSEHMQKFADWVFRPYVDKADNTESVQSTSDGRPTSGKDDFVLPSGKTMSLYRYLKYIVTTFGHTSREDLVDGAMKAKDTMTFERALTHPCFDQVLSKVFAVDQALEQMQGFKAMYNKMLWNKYLDDPKYLSLDISLRLFAQLMVHHDISQQSFVNDVWQLVTFAKPKQNLLFLHGVPNSGKSFIIRSLVALYKYSATCQGTTSFPFMELVKASFALIEEPSFTNENLQTLKLLAEGTSTEVSVKNRPAAKITRIPMAITANYPFWSDGGATEKQAFTTRIFHYKFPRSAAFLRLAKKPLNPAIW